MRQQPPPATNTVGQQLAKRREELDLTQEALARLVGVTAPTISVTERGHTEIRRGKRPDWERALRLEAGTISRAYRERTPVEPVAPASGSESYADLSDPHERAVWEMKTPEEDRREMIDILRSARRRGRRPA
jgi:transcriptional regulator with XRE-family HTH domain